MLGERKHLALLDLARTVLIHRSVDFHEGFFGVLIGRSQPSQDILDIRFSLINGQVAVTVFVVLSPDLVDHRGDRLILWTTAVLHFFLGLCGWLRLSRGVLKPIVVSIFVPHLASVFVKVFHDSFIDFNVELARCLFLEVVNYSTELVVFTLYFLAKESNLN